MVSKNMFRAIFFCKTRSSDQFTDKYRRGVISGGPRADPSHHYLITHYNVIRWDCYPSHGQQMALNTNKEKDKQEITRRIRAAQNLRGQSGVGCRGILLDTSAFPES